MTTPRARLARLGLLLLLLPATAGGGEAPAASEPGAPGVDLPRVTPRRREAKGYEEITEKKYRELTSIPSRPHRCPVCRYMVEIPLAEPKWTDHDADLCPHPEGRVTFHSPVVLCPNCGFSAYRQEFTRPQPEPVARWVTTQLREPTRNALRKIFGLDIPIAEEDLISLFDQEDLPDILRCENALAYYLRFRKEDPLALARITWTTAWAHRRSVSGPVEAGALLPHVQPTLAAVNRHLSPEADTARRINAMLGLYESPGRLDAVDRQILLIFLAGDYDRLGQPRWARQCLEKIDAEARSVPPDAAHDPWIATVPTDAEDPLLRARRKREALIDLARTYARNLARERELLARAAGRLREVLRADGIPPVAIPAHVYLVGEFERRAENFTRARTWFDYAAALRSPRPGAAIWAEDQIALMQDYMRDIGLQGYPADPAAAADRELLERLAAAVRAAFPDLQPDAARAPRP
jgi:hypothetical protein